jgi:hypothetical protein
VRLLHVEYDEIGALTRLEAPHPAD